MKYHDYLLDTNIIPYIIELENGGQTPKCQSLKKRLEGVRSSKLLLCPITVGEIEYGLRIAPYKDAEKQKQVRTFISSSQIMDIDVKVARDCYGELRSRLFNYCVPENKRHRGIEKKRIEEWICPSTSKELQIQENDLWIASVAMAYNLVLVTNDKMTAIKHVAGSEIRFEDWLSQ